VARSELARGSVLSYELLQTGRPVYQVRGQICRQVASADGGVKLGRALAL